MPYKVTNLNGTLQQEYLADPRILAALAAQKREPQPVYTPAQGIAQALGDIVDAYNMNRVKGEYADKQNEAFSKLADALAPPTPAIPATNTQVQLPVINDPGAPSTGVGIDKAGLAPVTAGGGTLDVSTPDIPQQDNPNREKLLAAFNAGIIDPKDAATPLLNSMGLGKPKEPIKGGPGDVFYDPDTHQPIPGMSVPTKPDKPEATPDIIQIAKQLYPDDPKAQNAYIVKNSPANLRSITNINTPKQNWQILTDPKTQTQFRYDLDSGRAFTLDGQPYTPGGAQKLMGGQPRSAASLAATMYLQEHPEATADDLTKFAANYGKTVKSTTAFGAGKQGDLVRSFNVAVSHLNTLSGLVDALNNGDMQAFNKLGNAVAQQTGQPAPTNFDAAKAIVGDEIIKAIVGGGGALADRENAQNQISRANSPAQLRGVINTYKELMAGQLRGLKKQYTDTTGQNDFDQRLSPEARAELDGGTMRKVPPPPPGFVVHH